MLDRLIREIKQGNVDYFYTCRTWKKKRVDILARDNNECQKCKRRGKFKRATCVHHKKHLRDYPQLCLDDDNLESLCDGCHNEEHPEKFIEVKPRKYCNVERWE